MLSHFTSQKFRFWSFLSMVLLVFVHGYNLNEGYLQPWTRPGEPLGFTTFTEYLLANGLFRFRIPMLFIISGYLFAMKDDKPHKQRVAGRVRTLLYPYLTWSAFGLLFTFFLEMFPYTREIVGNTHLAQIDETRTFIHQYYWYEVLARWLFFPVSYQLWFIRVLFIYNLAYPVLRWCVTHRMAWIYFSFAILFWLSTGGLILIEGEGLLFFSLGMWMQKSNFDIDNPAKWLQPKWWVPVFLGVSCLKTWLAFQPYFQGVEPILLLLHKLAVLSGLIVAWFGCNGLVNICMNKPWFVRLSAFSFMIYVLHTPLVVYATNAIFHVTNHWPYYRLVTYIVLPLVIVFLSIFIGILLRKCLPKAYSFLTGNRGLN